MLCIYVCLVGSNWPPSTASMSASSVPKESVSPTLDDPREVSPALVDLHEPRGAVDQGENYAAQKFLVGGEGGVE